MSATAYRSRNATRVTGPLSMTVTAVRLSHRNPRSFVRNVGWCVYGSDRFCAWSQYRDSPVELASQPVGGSGITIDSGPCSRFVSRLTAAVDLSDREISFRTASQSSSYLNDVLDSTAPVEVFDSTAGYPPNSAVTTVCSTNRFPDPTARSLGLASARSNRSFDSEFRPGFPKINRIARYRIAGRGRTDPEGPVRRPLIHSPRSSPPTE